MKKAFVITMICVLFFWVGRIYNINQNPPITTYYNIGDKVEFRGMEISFLESHLEDPEDFIARTGIDFDNGDDGVCKLLSVCLEVTNKSDKDIKKDSMMEWFEGGFVSPECWCSASELNTEQKLNKSGGEILPPGEHQKLWFVTVVNKGCFKEKEWKRINEREFLYILYCFANRTAVRLRS